MPICIQIPEAPAPLTLTLPGGAMMEHPKLLELIQPALTPLMPIFNIIDAVMAVFDCVKAIPDTIGPPPDPTALAQKIPALAQKVDKLLRLVPQLSLPYTIIDVIDLVLDTLRKALGLLTSLESQLSQISAAREHALALEDAGLLAITECAEGNVEREVQNLGVELGALQSLMGLLNIFLGMVGGPTAPDISSLSGQGLSQVRDGIAVIVTTLEGVRRAIPLP